MRRILLIDDDHEAGATLVKVLIRAGNDVVHERDSAAALPLHRDQPFHVWVVTIASAIDEIIERLRELRADDGSVRVIAMVNSFSASGANSDWTDGLNVDRILHKPFRPKDLVKLIEQL